MSDIAYHLQELAIARDPSDPRRSLPEVSADDRTVLDVGCGVGQTLVATPFHAGARLCGVDLDPAAVARGKAMFPELELAAGAAESLPFRSELFDLVTSRVALPFTDVPRAVSEIFRVLRPGGRVWFVLHRPVMELRELWVAARHRKPRLAAVALHALANGVLLHAAGRLIPLPGAGTYRSFQTAGGFSRMMRRVGFTACKAERCGGQFVFTARKPAAGTGAARGTA